MIRWGLIGLLMLLGGCASSYRDQSVSMTSIATFEAEKYAGLWYEVARFPVSFQEGCTNTQADYAPVSANELRVTNSCFRDGSLSVIEGTARVSGPGRLKVRLGGMPFPADYWVLWVDEDYDTAVVGVPSGQAGWILNRTPQISEDRLEAARAVLQFNGYDLSKLRMTPQEGGR